MMPTQPGMLTVDCFSLLLAGLQHGMQCIVYIPGPAGVGRGNFNLPLQDLA